MGESSEGYKPDREMLNRGGEQNAAESGTLTEAQQRSLEAQRKMIADREAQMKANSQQETQPIKPIVPGSAASRWAKR